jgi:hypothetical protein
MVELRVTQNVLTYHWPEVRTTLDRLETLKLTVVILVIVFAKGYNVPFHFLLFLCEPSDDVLVLEDCHWQVKNVHVVMVYNGDSILYIPWFGSISDKLKIGVRTLF